MKTVALTSLEHLQSIEKNTNRLFILFYKPGAEQSECAIKNIHGPQGDKDIILYSVDVSKVRDIHSYYGIDTAPTLLEIYEQEVKNIYKGCQTSEFYKTALSHSGFTNMADGENKKPVKRVTVYTTPSCSWCNTLKTYLKENNINFAEINVAANQSAAEEMVKKSGQQGVPQMDINGQLVVGFDKNRINKLLEISSN